MKPVAFEYCRPDTLAEALDLLAEAREEAVVLAGGMSLGPMLNLRMVRPKRVIDISRLGGLNGIDVQRGRVVTGATVVQADALASPIIRKELPLLALALPWVGHFQTRNSGTLGGSIAHADPSAEVPLCAVTGDATIVLRSRRRERRVRAGEFFVGALSTARQPDEMVVAIDWPRASPDECHAFEEIAQRHGDFAIAAAACEIVLDRDGRIGRLALGLGGVADRPIAIDTWKLAGALADGGMAATLARRVADGLDPMEDHVATADYRRALARVLIERVVLRAIAGAQRKAGGA
ncbi:MAG TPA: FAD binding domain-containing protein [Xanthobacteraceae bacterium]|nr:FAD binding domain-containing protein [Xanthobacteraceae bacterium]